MTYPVMTLPQLREATRQRADMVHSTFISDEEFNSYINASYFELYDLLVQKYGNDYYVKEYSFSLQGNVERYDLPEDFYKLLGVDLSISNGPDGYVTLRPFSLAERNRYSTANVQTWIGVTNLRYRLSGNKLWFTPSPNMGQTIRLWYIPRLENLFDPVTLTVAAQPVSGDTLTINGASVINLFAELGATIPVTATNIANAINALGGDVTATALNNVVTLTSATTTPIGLLVENTTSPTPTPGATTRIQLSAASVIGNNTTADGVSGWLEYVITDAAIKALQKEESDVSVLMAQKMALIKRIEAAGENRDAGMPAQVADVQWTNGTWPFGNGFGGGGGIP
jgi:hypothetical protein